MRRPNFALVLVVVSLALAGLQAEQGQTKPPISVPGEILVRFSPTAGSTRIQGFFGASATRVIKYYSSLDVYHLRVPSGQSTDKAIDQYRAMPEVLAAQPNYIRRAIALPNDPFFTSGQLWGLNKIRATDVWTGLTTGDSSVVVADIDTGVEYLHADLAANMWRNPSEIPGNGVDDDANGYVDDVFGIDVIDANEAPGGPENPMDDHGHGTHVAGTIAGVGNNGTGVAGVTWNSKILACKFLDSAGEGSDAGAIGCFDYILGLKRRGVNIRVSNNSWNGYTDGPSPVLQWAIDQTGSAGILHVFAAGNDGVNNDTAKVYCPASLASPSIISVAASDRNDNRASFSNFGATRVDLAAPGTEIASTFLNDYAESSGTSMAAAHVTGAAALLLALDSTLTVDSLKALILDNVDVLPQWQGAVASGGRLNVYGAATKLRGTTNPGASLVGVDTTTQGNWFLSYGVDGYGIHGDTIRWPAYATVSVTGGNSFEWTSSTTDMRALLRASGPGRLAAAWFGNAIGFDIAFSDGQPHDVAFYALDWDNNGRIQQFEVIDGVTGQSLATHTISGFQGGQYVIWRLTGSVRIRVTRIAGDNAVINGIFFGGPAGTNQPPTVAFTLPQNNATLGGASITVSANATDDIGIAQVDFFANGSPIGSDATSPYSINWTTVPAGPYTLTATVTDALGLTGTAVPVQITVTSGGASGPSAQFVGTDTTTQGNWIGVYGTEGYTIVNDSVSTPSYASLTQTGTIHVWSDTTTEVRALQRASGTGRIASAWFNNTFFDITLNLTDGQVHDVSFYSLDFDSFTRAQRFDVYDATTGALLATQSISGFRNGVYTLWRFSGNVRVRVTRNTGSNAVVSGVFFK